MALKENINLGDPHWELIDPTPNVHALFIQFDSKFFWGKLAGVVVRWSKRMYSCAGICRYEGRGGLCDIALSEPLLKLRPRKDLVETLLHEMIHAFLFLSDGDRDRDGHGPNFCHHMFRINNEAKLNISIYHSFHDEVKLYQTHWWRCEGPCQYRKPFFGIVRRPMNKAPGPNDRWWLTHQLTCGGTFTKIKEPECKMKKKNKEVDKSKFGDISKFVKKFLPNNNVVTICDLINYDKQCTSQSNISAVAIKETNNILNNCIKGPRNDNEQMKLVLADKPTTKSDKDVCSSENVIQTVRNHWASNVLKPHIQNKRKVDGSFANSMNKNDSNKNKDQSFQNNNGENFTLDMYAGESKTKKHAGVNIIGSEDVNVIEKVSCPLCSELVKSIYINEHLDKCLSSEKDKKLEIIDLTNALEKNQFCPVCNQVITDSLNDHLEFCLSFFKDDETAPADCSLIVPTSFDDDSDNDLDESQTFNETGTKFPCPCCFDMIEQESMNVHLDECLK